MNSFDRKTRGKSVSDKGVTASTTDGHLTPQLLLEWHQTFKDNPACKLAMNAVTQTPVDDIALNRAVVAGTDFTFSHWLDDWTVTHQKQSGRCWMFAGLNLLRAGAMKKMRLKDFEFSQNHTLFWDKLERSNYFLEKIIETANLPVDDRVVAFLLSQPIGDGGQWNMFVNIIRKHGLVPKAMMPETESSSNTGRMNSILAYKLHEGAKLLREIHAHGGSPQEIRAAKREILVALHRILCIHLGTPPENFLWQWNDKDRKFHRGGMTTPLQFAKKFLTLPLDTYVCLVHDPRPAHPFNRTYTVQHLGNVVGGGIVLYLNVDINLMKDLTMRTIMGGEPVWMGCDVGPMMRRDLGIWDKHLYEYEAVYNTAFTLDKAARLIYHQTCMSHAMLFTGVDVVNRRPRRWRVENSWGEEKCGRKGFFVMNDSWFDEYMFEISVRRNALPKHLQKALELPPIVLPPWDPMGNLAR